MDGTQLDQVINNAIEWSFRKQNPKGYWEGQVEAGCTMEAEWILAMHFLGVTDDPKKDEVVRCIRNMQRTDGSWDVYHEAPAGDLSTTVECYVALKASGSLANEASMVAARKWIFEHGGLPATRGFTKIWLALVGEWSWDDVPCVPPEIIFLPQYFPFNLYNFSYWARGAIVPLTILSARRPVRPLPLDLCCHELHEPEDMIRERQSKKIYTLSNLTRHVCESLFLYLDKFLIWYGKSRFKPGREVAIACCLAWILRRQESDGSWCGIQPPWVYSLMALSCEGFGLDHPAVRSGIRAFDAPFAVETTRGTYTPPCTSVIWDTLLMQLSLLDCGIDYKDPKLALSLNYILDKQVLVKGDWCVKVPDALPGGWCFQFENAFYPDLDDTAVAMIVLSTAASYPDRKRVKMALERALGWITGMVCSNGAWASFDKDNTNQLLCMLPFCDYGEVLDPPSADVTAHVVQALGVLGRTMKDPLVAGALKYIRAEQEQDGSWFGRWGVNHIYGVGCVLPALEAVGENMESAYVLKACSWVVAHQNEDGGWGESCASYVDQTLRGVGPSTPSQTGWALMALLAQGSAAYLQPIRNGVDYLVRTQTSEGSWREEYFTGTGFPGYGGGGNVDLRSSSSQVQQGKELSRGLMMRYHMYRHYFPLMALGRSRQYFANLQGSISPAPPSYELHV